MTPMRLQRRRKRPILLEAEIKFRKLRSRKLNVHDHHCFVQKEKRVEDWMGR